MLLKRIILCLGLFFACAVGGAHAINMSGVDTSDANRVVAIGYPRFSVTDSITAFAGGGQTSAVLLTSAVNRVSTVASGNDSVKLPVCQSAGLTAISGGQPTHTTGQMMYVINAAAANSMNVFPSSGGSINALSANAAYAVAANKTVGFICIGTIWYSLLGG